MLLPAMSRGSHHYPSSRRNRGIGVGKSMQGTPEQKKLKSFTFCVYISPATNALLSENKRKAHQAGGAEGVVRHVIVVFLAGQF